jgi:GT2 family glycosyltransferase
MVLVDNNTDDSTESIQEVVDGIGFSFPIKVRSYKHGDSSRTHSWSSNIAVKEAKSPWIFFCRADYLLADQTLEKFTANLEGDIFVSSRGCHLECGLPEVELTRWRGHGSQILTGLGTLYDYTNIDSGVWLARRESFLRVGGLDEKLTAWGHAQTHFQWKLFNSGVEFVCHPEVLFFHMQHGGEKDMDLANRQLMEQGVSLQEMWARYQGPRMY